MTMMLCDAAIRASYATSRISDLMVTRCAVKKMPGK